MITVNDTNGVTHDCDKVDMVVEFYHRDSKLEPTYFIIGRSFADVIGSEFILAIDTDFEKVSKHFIDLRNQLDTARSSYFGLPTHLEVTACQ